MSELSNTTANPGPVKILIANDQEWTARSLESILAPEGFEVIRAYTGQQALGLALDQRPDLVVLDFQLPDVSGPDVCRALRADPRVGWGTPIVITTAGANGRSRMAEALDAGAWDFQAQPFDGPTLLERVRTYLRAKSALDAARRDAMLEPASGLYSERGLGVRLGELALEVRRHRQPVTCVAVSAGSPTLREAAQAAEGYGLAVARALRSAIRGSDVVARVGTMDFVVVAPTLDGDAALAVVDRMQEALSAISAGEGPSPIQIRTGMATIGVPDDGFDPEDLVRRAMAAVDWAEGHREAPAAG